MSDSSSSSTFPPEDQNLKAYFISLHHHQHDTIKPTTLASEQENIFTADRETYNFEQNLSSSVLNDIRAMLDEEDGCSLNSSVEKTLNPRAHPFVPGLKNGAGNCASARLVAIDTINRFHQRYNHSLPLLLRPSSGLESSPWLAYTRHPPNWRHSLNLAAHTTPMNESSIDEYGRDLVHGQIWSRCGLVDLIQHVCWKGSEPSFDTHPLSVALLAFSVYNHFKAIGDQKNASTFLDILQRCVKGYFEAFWDAENKGSALRFTPDSSFAPEYIQCASRFVAFTGCLYRCDVIDRETVLHCLWILICQLTAPEHLYAILSLVECSGVYCRNNGSSDIVLVHRFVRSLVAVTQQQLSSVPNIQRTTDAILRLVTEQSGCSMDVLQ
ncbi:hypothetical protein C8J55DRAFT_100847 [Lentinula edodes]|uniref:Uncharacterized protein n=1 Tax=Lentinula lateritia TaxID=40482 RepID=A0A9W9B1E4_9AGAR|nr:hypothetical protein C8J55DRAFT_100847 [Lentinula edodes]